MYSMFKDVSCGDGAMCASDREALMHMYDDRTAVAKEFGLKRIRGRVGAFIDEGGYTLTCMPPAKRSRP